jgi:hypothetical protein
MDGLSNKNRRAAAEEYLRLCEIEDGVLPDATPLPYDSVLSIGDVIWPVPFIDRMVDDDLRELTNGLNEWKGALRRWCVWNKVLTGIDQESRWGVEWEFVEPLAFMNMFQPSSTRDRFGYVATNALHQILRGLDPKREDRLAGDPKDITKKARTPGRTERETQLVDMVQRWPEGALFITALQALDGDDYEKATKDFRNRASHAIAPRFTYGETEFVTRRWQPDEFERQNDGSLRPISVPKKLQVVYEFGGTSPLGMDATWKLNVSQFDLARKCFEAYTGLLNVAISGMKGHDKGTLATDEQ